jgi:hypothetical protein
MMSATMPRIGLPIVAFRFERRYSTDMRLASTLE